MPNTIPTNGDSKPKLRIAIVGAGIGGLALALSLDRLDPNNDLPISVHIYESASALLDTGLGVSILSRTWELLKVLGCDKYVKERAWNYSRMGRKEVVNADAAFVYRKSDQREGYTFLRLTSPGAFFNVHRADLHKALLNKLSDRYHLHLSSRVVSCTESPSSSQVTLTFQDGTTSHFDLVIGADGVKSTIRKHLITNYLPHEIDKIDPVMSGSEGYRWLIPREVLEKRRPGHRALSVPLMYCGKTKHIVSYPISGGSQINVAAIFSNPEDEGKPLGEETVRDATLQEMLDRYEGWEEEVVDLLKCMEGASSWTFLTTKPISSYGVGRIAVLGDAAHAMTPHLASGAGQAIEDAYILASVITAGVQDNISVSRMIEVYSTVRQPMANFVLSSSRSLGFLCDLNVPDMEDVKVNDENVDVERMVSVGERIIRVFKWSWATSVLEDQKRAMALI